MGVRSLKTFIRVSCPQAVGRGDLADLGGRTLAIDAPCIVHRLWSRWARESRFKLCRVDASSDAEWRAFISREMSLMFKGLRDVGCRAILVNEGAAPHNKRRAIQRRQLYRESVRRRADRVLGILGESDEVDPAILHELRDLTLSDRGAAESPEDDWTLVVAQRRRRNFRDRAALIRRAVRRYNSSISPSHRDYRLMNEIAQRYGAATLSGICEAETVCASLVFQGLADVAMSNDTDAIVYMGGSRVVCEIFPETGEYEYVDRDLIIEHLGALSEEEFIRALIFCGTDYNSPLRPGLDPRSALDELRRRGDSLKSPPFQDVFAMYTFTRPGDELWFEKLRKMLAAAEKGRAK